MPAPLDARERAQLCLRFDELGPDAPTLCEGWATIDLAAHLVVRDRRPLALPGTVLGGPLAWYTDRVTKQVRDQTPWAELVRLIRGGPSLGPVGLPGLDDVQNLSEFFVHHEDVRRANGMGPRGQLGALDDALWSRLTVLGPLLTRRVPVGLILQAPGRAPRRAHPGAAPVVLAGTPGELVLWLFGRRTHADVELDGPTDALARLGAAQVGP